jgi:rhamnosyltransferase
LKVYAVVTWFQPEAKYVDNLRTYRDQVEGVIVVDDSLTDHAALLRDMTDVGYICEGNNLGQAHALNVGYARARELGADWVLTMDQDSSFDKEQFRTLLSAAERVCADPRVAAIGPNFAGSGLPVLVDAQQGQRDCNSVISSGCLVRLTAHREIGGYNEQLFIDQVDHEFCYRLRRHDYRVLRLEGILMRHEVGSPLHRRLFGFNIRSTNHSAARKYYAARNVLFMRRHFADFGAPYLEMLCLMFLGVLFLEDDKLPKLACMLKGCWHHLRGVYGKMH